MLLICSQQKNEIDTLKTCNVIAIFKKYKGVFNQKDGYQRTPPSIRSPGKDPVTDTASGREFNNHADQRDQNMNNNFKLLNVDKLC